MLRKQAQEQGLEEEISELEGRLENARARLALATGTASFQGKNKILPYSEPAESRMILLTIFFLFCELRSV
jgi:hypothetical protein